MDKLIERIKEEAEKEIKDIIDNAQEEAKKIIEEEEEKGKEEAEKIRREGIKEAGRRKEKILAAGRRKAKSYLIKAREEIIENCINKIKEYLKKLDGKKYEKIVGNLVKEGVKEIRDGYIISTREEDEKIAKKFGMEVKKKVNGIGGVILKSKDGKKEIDLTFDTMIERRKDEIRIKIAEKLFGGK